MNTEPTPTPPIAMVPVKSKQISSIGYAGGVLAIEFTPRAGEVSGSVYEYQGVTQEMFDEFAAAKSKGNYFYANIRNEKEKYPFTKVREAVPEPADASEPGREAA